MLLIYILFIELNTTSSNMYLDRSSWRCWRNRCCRTRRLKHTYLMKVKRVVIGIW